MRFAMARIWGNGSSRALDTAAFKIAKFNIVKKTLLLTQVRVEWTWK